MKLSELRQFIKSQILEKKLCPKGKAYYDRRIAAGESPSAYLSGRAVKVCKGLMEEDDLDMHESLRDWFDKEDWVRIDTQGNITGPCGTMKKGQATTRCLPRAKANRLSKEERAATSRKKAAEDRKGDRVVPNTDKAKVRFNKENLNEDCGCNGPKLILKEGQNPPTLSEGLKYHISEGIQLIHNIYRPLSENYMALFKEARELYNQGLLSVTENDAELLETNIGETFNYKGVDLPLDYLLTEEELISEVDKKKVQLGKPHRGGSKKFYVYVKKPNGKIKKVSFGMAGGGLRAKLNNPKARRAFSDRMRCPQAKDRTTARYWSCRLPRYAKLLGFKTSFSGYW